ncbi:hypothetical protein B0H15DRAFT_813999 [Mycena belliarum]|uniref:chitin deacetylase n=1 Tax=Mycena belliarum TaxID=1033014 RepID=A0AAD6XYR2_9AGAR|nr:hypothetical protein B0H15DRAFT_813999 [Mycena belliae]
MKTILFSSLAVAAVAAHNPLEARQSASSAASAGTGAPPPSSFSFTLATTNPTAIPLASIVSNAQTQATHALPTTFSPGATPTAVKGAPPLPNAALLAPSSYPALDVIVRTDSPEVQQWISEVNKSGIPIPDIAPTVAGGCPANPVAAADADKSRCWWTCGGCVQATDITTCPDKLTWGLTYDDGPSPYTPDLLQFLNEKNLKSTFFVVGSRVISFPSFLQTEYMQGHQIAVHTWSHPSLTTLTNAQIIGELGWSKKVIKDVLGVTPSHFRPPFGDIDNRVRAIAKAMGLTPVMWTRISPMATFDTDDFDLHSGASTASKVLQNWNFIEANATTFDTGFILLEHDLFQQSVDIATGYILPDALAHQPAFKIEPVISCMNKPLTDAYIETNDNKTNPPAQSASGGPGSAQATGGSGSNGSAVVAALPGLGSVVAFTISLIAVMTL